MAVYRTQASIRFTKESGYATWAYNQMKVRREQAVHLNKNKKNKELAHNTVVEHDNYELFSCDLPLLDESHAKDAFNTLAAVIHPAWVYIPEDEEEDSSWVKWQTCYHDETPTRPCKVHNTERLPK